MKQNDGNKKNLIIKDKDYAVWVKELAGKYRSEQIKAACSVNSAIFGIRDYCRGKSSAGC